VAKRSATVAPTLFWLFLADRTFWPPAYLAEADFRADPGGLKSSVRNGEAGAALAVAMTRVYMSGAMEKIESVARLVIAACAEGDMLRSQLAILRRLCKYEPFNTLALRRTIAQRVIETGKYMVA